jgi:uncharacterized repeat protein (TIGR01451 family)
MEISLSADPERAYAGQAVTLTVKLTNNSSTPAGNVFVDVSLPSMYAPFNNPTGVFNPVSRLVQW